jgi:hypothetical protein
VGACIRRLGLEDRGYQAGRRADDLGTLVNGGQPRSGCRGLLRSGHPSTRFSRLPPPSSRPTCRRGLELTRMSPGATVVGGPPEEARRG